jgi:hypothetical protein
MATKRRKRPAKSRGPVSAKSARSPGRSRDPIISAATGTPAIDRELFLAEACDAPVGRQSVRYFKRKRKNRTKLGPAGSTYTGQIVKGEKCGALAIMTKYVDGKRVHRCAKHIGQQ